MDIASNTGFVRRAAVNILTAILFLACAPLATGADEPPRLFIVLDNSITMEDELGNSLKYKAVRNALRKVLPSFEGRFTMGLATFGSNDRNNCQDVETDIPLQPLSAKAFSLALAQSRPKGRSPIGAALAQAIAAIGDKQAQADILLLVDGGDNCSNNVCATTQILAQNAPGIRVHMIGLGNNSGLRSLSCISETTQGTQILVESEEELTTALAAILQTSLLSKREPPTENKLEAQLPTEESKQVSEEITETPADLTPPPLPVRRPKRKQLTRAPSKHQESLTSSKAPQMTSGLQDGPTKPVEKREEQLPLSAANNRSTQAPSQPRLTATAPQAPVREEIRIQNENSEAETPSNDNSYDEAEPATVQSASEPATAPEPEKKEARAETTTAPANPFASGKPTLDSTLQEAKAPVHFRALLTEAGKEIKTGVVWRIYIAERDPNGKFKLMETHETSEVDTGLKVGAYLINATWGRAHMTEKLDILSTKPLKRDFVLNAGGLRLSARYVDGEQLPPRQVSYRIYSDERDQFGRRQLILDKAPPGKIIRLNAGIYHIESLYGGANGLVETDITVEAGKLTDAVVNHTATKVTFKLVNKPGGEALAGATWRILSPDGKVVKETGGALPTQVLAAGEYMIQAQYAGRTFARKVSIEPGDPIHVEIVIQ